MKYDMKVYGGTTTYSNHFEEAEAKADNTDNTADQFCFGDE
jgi:hypothetical protein